MRVAINLKKNAFYKTERSKKNLTGGTLIGVWTCTNLPPLTSTLFAKTNQQIWLAFLDIVIKQGVVSEFININMPWQDTLDLKFFCFWVFGVCLFELFFLFFFATDGAEHAPAHHSFLIWPSDETHNWGNLGSWRIQMLNSRINFSSRGIWESDPLPWLSWQLGLTPSNPKGSFLY